MIPDFRLGRRIEIERPSPQLLAILIQGRVRLILVEDQHLGIFGDTRRLSTNDLPGAGERAQSLFDSFPLGLVLP